MFCADGSSNSTFDTQVATAKGDYTMKGSRNFSFQYAYSIVLGMQQAAITWVSECMFSLCLS